MTKLQKLFSNEHVQRRNSRNLNQKCLCFQHEFMIRDIIFDDHVAVYVAFHSFLPFDFRVKVTLPRKKLNSTIMRLFNVVPNTCRI